MITLKTIIIKYWAGA